LDKKCRALKGLARKIEQERQKKEDTSIEAVSGPQKEMTRQRKNLLRQRHQLSIFERAKKEIRETSGTCTIPANEFKIFIKTPYKSQCNWVYGD
jgi:hypothetical protein